MSMLDKQGKIPVPRKVLDGLEAVRASGLINMLDRPGVARLARLMDFPEAAEWAETHHAEYAHGIFRGFTTKGKTE